MKKLALVVSASVLALTGCASQEVDYGAYFQAQAELATKPTITLDCPAGCSMSYTDPRDKQMAVPKVTNGYDAAIAIGDRLLGAAVSVAPWYGVTRLGIEGIQAVRDTKGETNTHMHVGDVVGSDKIGGDSTGADKIGGDSTGADKIGGSRIGQDSFGGDYTGPVQRDVIGGDRVSNSGRLSSPDDSTHQPTVVIP